MCHTIKFVRFDLKESFFFLKYTIMTLLSHGLFNDETCIIVMFCKYTIILFLLIYISETWPMPLKLNNRQN